MQRKDDGDDYIYQTIYQRINGGDPIKFSCRVRKDGTNVELIYKSAILEVPSESNDADYVADNDNTRLTPKDLNSNPSFSQVYDEARLTYPNLNQAVLIDATSKSGVGNIEYKLFFDSPDRGFLSVDAEANVATHKKTIGTLKKISITEGFSAIDLVS